jgi:hypothetical protein
MLVSPVYRNASQQVGACHKQANQQCENKKDPQSSGHQLAPPVFLEADSTLVSFIGVRASQRINASLGKLSIK